ncbi:septum site-determining protein MinC [Paraburkholderia bannensis]|uniref:Probable septum site-determining protein MinC n=1 Tax=Paraburkholderia bannensis TaxID=765414 RepID=A0A7W9TS18_9BURK|nr:MULTISPECIES: septum site-determining protein MinC [Paraburkholderia]MBB3255518.1 septum site-determining protein MinC [Paraburkholderia sp. WP4_3_2]MBB6100471.1 septum site-determining protein MinC [Paraburkholderia bannensis]
MSPKKSPYFELKSGSVDTLLFVVKTTELDAMRAELTRRFEATPEFFANDTVAIDLRRLADGEQVALGDIARLLESVRMRPVGVVAQPEQHGWAAAAGLPFLEARDRRVAGGNAAAKSETEDGTAAVAAAVAADVAADAATANASATPAATQPELFPTDPTQDLPAQTGTEADADIDARSNAPRAATLVVDRPLRSGQRVYAKGDLVVLGMVSNGAEVIAEGNIHIYAPLRGRALAGVHGNHDARIFCTSLEAELISIAGIYRTTEVPLSDDVRGKPAQIRLDEEKLLIEPLRLT